MKTRGVFRCLWGMLMQYTSPVFLMLILLSTVMWYVAKLSYTYTTQIPIDVSVEDNHFRVYCMMEGSGYRLFAHRYILNDEVRLSLSDIEYAPSIKDKDLYTINQFSLQNAISTRKNDIRVISIGDIPEMTIINQEE